MALLLCCRVGISAYGVGEYLDATWPLGRLMLTDEALYVTFLLMDYSLPLGDIERIRHCFPFGVVIEHHAPGVPALLGLWGFRLYGRLHEAVERHHLPVVVGEQRRPQQDVPRPPAGAG